METEDRLPDIFDKSHYAIKKRPYLTLLNYGLSLASVLVLLSAAFLMLWVVACNFTRSSVFIMRLSALLYEFRGWPLGFSELGILFGWLSMKISRGEQRGREHIGISKLLVYALIGIVAIILFNMYFSVGTFCPVVICAVILGVVILIYNSKQKTKTIIPAAIGFYGGILMLLFVSWFSEIYIHCVWAHENSPVGWVISSHRDITMALYEYEKFNSSLPSALLPALTSPVAHMRSVPNDPFSQRWPFRQEEKLYRYYLCGNRWVLQSAGPDWDYDINLKSSFSPMVNEATSSWNAQVLGLSTMYYNPRNGIISDGDIITTGP
jgi:hypothetical protein